MKVSPFDQDAPPRAAERHAAAGPDPDVRAGPFPEPPDDEPREEDATDEPGYGHGV
jgi:hypothetical protein